jgi:hypothetical protein
MIEQVDPFECGELDSFDVSPGPASVDYLGLVEPVDALGRGVVATVPDTAHGWFDPGLGQALGVADTAILRAIGMMNQTAVMDRPAVMDGLIEGVQHEAGMGGSASFAFNRLYRTKRCHSMITMPCRFMG